MSPKSSKASTKKKAKQLKKGALVVGGGVAGMQAALDIASQGYKVYLVEKSPSIGGRMAQLDKTFPTLDCSACILTPRLSEVSRHPNIELITYANVESVVGKMGDFKARVIKRSRYVHQDRCSGCGDCAAECPVEVPNEFDQGLGFRKAIYIPFAQATPNIYTVDMDSCIECNRCLKACQRDAIDLEMQDERLEFDVGAIVIATGYEMFDVRSYPRLGYGRLPDVIDAMEYERLINAAGPTGGHLIRLSDGRIPESIGFVQCVGARDVGKDVPYCSRVCCMYGIKNAVMAKEHHPDTDVTVYYADIRAFGKGFEQFYDMAQTRFGVNFMRGRVAEVTQSRTPGKLKVRVENTLTATPLEVEHDLVVISPGILPAEGMDALAEKLGVTISEDGYVDTVHHYFGPVDTKIPGVFVCGCADGPKDIPDSVTEGSAAAMKATIILSKAGVK
ncbi:MAG: CoB--CoM heterodisulfide reductase iron-sulfur subunit A family protein [Candidatus Thorarchaeota archaeon]|nr:CoB--CoM heterodisulfide reductase iron-sulfur subunit A family protein [Candidatus Thorarchaeota archaeon]